MAENKAGRPAIEIDKDNFEKLCGIQCTLEEIAGFFNCSHDTIERWCKKTYEGKTFKEVFEDKRSSGLISLRRHQFRQAETNATMAIWLGKQYLGQKDILLTNVYNDGEDDPLTKSIKEQFFKRND
jgi:hypothetical protein